MQKLRLRKKKVPPQIAPAVPVQVRLHLRLSQARSLKPTQIHYPKSPHRALRLSPPRETPRRIGSALRARGRQTLPPRPQRPHMPSAFPPPAGFFPRPLPSPPSPPSIAVSQHLNI